MIKNYIFSYTRGLIIAMYIITVIRLNGVAEARYTNRRRFNTDIMI